MSRRRSDDPSVAGLCLVDKPSGLTSHDVVSRVRRAVGMRRVGHSGTLDPMATGLLVVGVGWVTRVLRYTGEFPKTYVAMVAFGAATDTMDADGEVTQRCSMHVDQATLEGVLSSFVGSIEQVPPMVSAIKVGGERLYAKARRGESVERKPRNVTVHELRLVEVSGQTATLEATVSAGTYIRVLAHDLGQVLGGCAHLCSLRRTRIGPHDVENALPLERIDALGRSALLPAGQAAAGLPCITLHDPVDIHAVVTGRLFSGEEPPEGPTAIVGPGRRLLAIHEPDVTGVARVGCVVPAPEPAQ